MAIEVEAFTQYLTASVESMRGADYDGILFVNALKEKPFTGYASIKVAPNRWTRIDNANPNLPASEIAAEIFCNWACQRIVARQVNTPCILVPIPNKMATVVKPGDDFPTFRLARKLAAKFQPGVSAQPLLRWKRALRKSQEGGPRDVRWLYPELASYSPTQADGVTFILIDDVCTGGGHIQACAAKLREHGLVASLAFCGGRTFHEQQPEPFALPPVTFDDYVR